MAIRDEWFGGGISELLRIELGISTTKEMAKAIQPEIFPESGSADDLLKMLVESEYTRYLRLSEGDDLKFFSRVQIIVNSNASVFPKTKEILDRYQSEVQENPLSASNLLAPLAFLFEFSQVQSRKTRAGSSLEHQLQYVLENNGITKFETQKTVTWGGGNSAKLDFIFPSVEHFNNDPHDCILFSCQTSSNDRIRSALAQGIEGQKYVPTLLGSNNISTSLQKLSKAKLDYVKSKGAKYVMFPEGQNMTPIMTNSSVIIAYQDLIEKIKQRHDAWPNP